MRQLKRTCPPPCSNAREATSKTPFRGLQRSIDSGRVDRPPAGHMCLGEKRAVHGSLDPWCVQSEREEQHDFPGAPARGHSGRMDDLTLAHHLADQADAIALRHIAAGNLTAQIKHDGSPVTAADREVEDVLRACLRQLRPHDAFLGEEGGAHGNGDRQWIIDAIDGTASFLAGRPEWGTLIALEERGTITTGLVTAPALSRRWWASIGTGTWTGPLPSDAQQRSREVTVAPPTDLHEATIGIWPPPSRLTKPHRALAAKLAAHAKSTRPALDWTSTDPPDARIPKPSTGSGTCHGGLLVATGKLDAFILLGAGPWDIAALVPVVEEAGGLYADLTESPQARARTALFSTIGLHQQILGIAQRCSCSRLTPP